MLLLVRENVVLRDRTSFQLTSNPTCLVWPVQKGVYDAVKHSSSIPDFLCVVLSASLGSNTDHTSTTVENVCLGALTVWLPPPYYTYGSKRFPVLCVCVLTGVFNQLLSRALGGLSMIAKSQLPVHVVCVCLCKVAQ